MHGQKNIEFCIWLQPQDFTIKFL